jgi:hypothetical protein
MEAVDTALVEGAILWLAQTILSNSYSTSSTRGFAMLLIIIF